MDHIERSAVNITGFVLGRSQKWIRERGFVHSPNSAITKNILSAMDFKCTFLMYSHYRITHNIYIYEVILSIYAICVYGHNLWFSWKVFYYQLYQLF